MTAVKETQTWAQLQVVQVHRNQIRKSKPVQPQERQMATRSWATMMPPIVSLHQRQQHQMQGLAAAQQLAAQAWPHSCEKRRGQR